MSRLSETVQAWILGAAVPRPSTPRRPRRVVLACDSLEGRVTPSHFGGGFAGAVAYRQAAMRHFGGGQTTTTTTSTATALATAAATTTTTNTALDTALTTLRNDINTILSSSSVTVAQINAINTAYRTLRTDGLRPSSPSALASFQDKLVTTYASGTAVVDNATLLEEFKAIFTTSPTDQQAADLTTAYNALAAAVTSSNITQANITTIDADWAAVVAARGTAGTGKNCDTTTTTSTTTSTTTTTPTFPYFSLVTGQVPGLGGRGGFGGGPRGRR
ncbi:MAG: hypothetical protein U0794_10005 [Isosphaeraceae bacterium]